MSKIKNWISGGTGSYKISELSVDDSVLKHLTTGTKYLECTTEGNLYISLPNTSQFSVEFDVNMTTVGLFSYLYLLDSPMYSTANGYGVGTGYRNMIMRLTAGTSSQLSRTDSGVILNNVWYSFRLTRTISGVMTLYVRGGVFGQNWNLVNMTGGLGTNPTTDTAHSRFKTAMLVLRVGDRIANLKIYNGVKQ